MQSKGIFKAFSMMLFIIDVLNELSEQFIKAQNDFFCQNVKILHMKVSQEKFHAGATLNQ